MLHIKNDYYIKAGARSYILMKKTFQERHIRLRIYTRSRRPCKRLQEYWILFKN